MKKPAVGIRARLLLGAATLAMATQGNATTSHDPDRSTIHAARAAQAPRIDGVADDPVWQRAAWQPLDQVWLGGELSPDDFSGRFKVAWTPERIYLQVEFRDDILIDTHRHPLEQYWDDDCLEIFIDENHSGGDHQYNHNAFAYHLSLDNQAIDIGTDRVARSYSHHVESAWKQQGGLVIWEVAIEVYTDAYVDDAADNVPVSLEAGKVMGFMVAYCDNDGSEIREHFVGSEYAAGDHKDRGWIDAGLFGTLILAP
jgi:hypothetical protein